ncbi:MAG: hypothetical protein AB7S44_00505 [Spirochaetales bacterium]
MNIQKDFGDQAKVAAVLKRVQSLSDGETLLRTYKDILAASKRTRAEYKLVGEVEDSMTLTNYCNEIIDGIYQKYPELKEPTKEA